MGNIAVITARGGSKRIPGKNIKDFLGKPIIAYSIEAALESGLFEEVMVSTDSKEIAEIAIKYGAKVPFMRSAKNSDDFATTMDVLKEVVANYHELGRDFDWLCCLYPTAPFVTSSILLECMEKIKNENADALTPVTRFNFPPQRAFVLNEKNEISYKWPENQNKRSQDLESLYHDAGQFYFMKTDGFFDPKIKIKAVIAYIMDDLHVQDIDNIDDWVIAEIKYEIIKRKNY